MPRLNGPKWPLNIYFESARGFYLLYSATLCRNPAALAQSHLSIDTRYTRGASLRTTSTARPRRAYRGARELRENRIEDHHDRRLWENLEGKILDRTVRHEGIAKDPWHSYQRFGGIKEEKKLPREDHVDDVAYT